MRSQNRLTLNTGSRAPVAPMASGPSTVPMQLMWNSGSGPYTTSPGARPHDRPIESPAVTR
jgi:hypothetical protein